MVPTLQRGTRSNFCEAPALTDVLSDECVSRSAPVPCSTALPLPSVHLSPLIVPTALPAIMTECAHPGRGLGMLPKLSALNGKGGAISFQRQ